MNQPALPYPTATRIAGIGLFDMVLALSRALDLVHPAIADHHLRVGYIASSLAEAAGLPPAECYEVAIAGALHDIGSVSSPERLSMLGHALHHFRVDEGSARESIHRHAEEGWLLLRDFPPFTRTATIVRYHHVPWANGAGGAFAGQPVPAASHLVHLADRIAILIRDDRHVLGQVEDIRRQIDAEAGSLFCPRWVAAFDSQAGREAFWLDIVCPEKEAALRRRLDGARLQLSIDQLQSVAQVFGRIIDYRSPFTASHSTGVAMAAEELAGCLGMSDDERRLISIAGYLHDLGKLAVPAEILDKPGKLTAREMEVVRSHPYHTHRILAALPGFEIINDWAASHHERVDGRGYPFRRGELSLGARIVAVADVFTALTEDRPYRSGMSPRAAADILWRMVGEGALDGDVVRTLLATA